MKTHTDERGLTRFFLEPKDAKSPDEPYEDAKHYLHQLSLSSKEALHRINDLPDGFLDNLKGKTLIGKDLLQEIRNHLAYDARDKANTSSEGLLNKLDSLYPYRTC